MDKTRCFYIITTVKPNIRIHRRGAVIPQARGRFTPSMGQNGFIGVHFKLVITYVLVLSYSKYIYIPQHYYCTIMHRQVMDTKYTTFPLRGPGCPRFPYNIDSLLSIFLTETYTEKISNKCSKTIGVLNRLIYVLPRTYMHWTAVSATRGASRAPELAAKVTSAEEVLPTFGLRATGMELPNIERILAVNKTV